MWPLELFQLRQLRAVRDPLSLIEGAAKKLVSAFISSSLDYCNSLLVGIKEGLLDRLQRVQNAAARLVTGTRKYDHITPVLSALHWLPVRQRIIYKVALLMYKCVHSLAPLYLAEDCLTVIDAWPCTFTICSGTKNVHTIDGNHNWPTCLCILWSQHMEQS